MKQLTWVLGIFSCVYLVIFGFGYGFQMPVATLSKAGSMWSYTPTGHGTLGMIKRADGYWFRCGKKLLRAGVSSQNTFGVGVPIHFVTASSEVEMPDSCRSPELVIDTNTRIWVLVSLLRS